MYTLLFNFTMEFRKTNNILKLKRSCAFINDQNIWVRAIFQHSYAPNG